MTTPSQFIATSDYATLKNDNGTSTTVTFPASTVIAGSGSSVVTSDLVIGAAASINRVQISSSKDSNTRYATLSLSFGRTGTSSGSPASYDIFAFVTRISSTTLRCSAYVPNPYGASLTTATGDETFTFYIDTFLPPFV